VDCEQLPTSPTKKGKFPTSDGGRTSEVARQPSPPTSTPSREVVAREKAAITGVQSTSAVVDHDLSTPLNALVKRKGKQQVDPLKHRTIVISKPTSKHIKLGKKLRGRRLNSLPLLAVFSNPDLNIEDLVKMSCVQ